MKTKLLPLFAALLLSQALMAQFHIGIKGGANVTKVDGKSFKDQFRYGYHLGGFAEIRMGN
ncbi:MAG: PorT family protein, partial [Chitinophagaceae bacterium]